MNLCIWLRINAHTEDRNYPLFKTRTVYTVTTAPKEVPRRLRFRSGKRNQRLAQKPVSDNRLSGLGCRSLPLDVAGHLRRHTESWGVESARSMDRFPNDREALDFIASRIADEAQRDSVALSEVERKMLYFSETAWTLPDILDINVVETLGHRDCHRGPVWRPGLVHKQTLSRNQSAPASATR